MSKTKHRIVVHVKIKHKDGRLRWHFDCEYEGFCHETGKITLQEEGETEITYLLWGYEYQLIFINLDPRRCAERQIHTVLVDTVLNSITVVDTNDWGLIGSRPICLRLVARKKNDIGCYIISPDPEVENDPHSGQN